MRRLRLASLTATLLLATACHRAPPGAAPQLSEAAGWLRDYLRLDTTNPPGDEGAAVNFLAGVLAAEGIASERLDAGDGRPSLWAYLPPTEGGAADTLLLLHHSDVVAADATWSHPAFAGDVADGALWGRGAIDSKGLGVAHLAAMVALQRSGAPRHRGVALLAAADEELGGGKGVARWLERRPDLFASVRVVINEGGTNRGYQGRLHWWGVEVSQKRPLWLEATAADPATLVAGLRRVIDLPPAWRVPAVTRTAFAALAPLYNEPWRRIFSDLDRFVPAEGPRVLLLPGMESLFLDSVQVNELELLADGRARARIDVRLLPDSDDEAWSRRLREALGSAVETKTLLAAPAVEPSPWDGRWIEILKAVLGPEAPVEPQVSAGITDSRYFRQRGVPAYGLSPFVLDSVVMRGVHAADERMPLGEFDRGVHRMTEIVAAWAGSAAD